MWLPNQGSQVPCWIFFVLPGSLLWFPRTQMTLVLIEKGLVRKGWPSKIEVSWVLGSYIKNTTKVHGTLELPHPTLVDQTLGWWGSYAMVDAGSGMHDGVVAETVEIRFTDLDYKEKKHGKKTLYTYIYMYIYIYVVVDDFFPTSTFVWDQDFFWG